ncbi:unnamed protein product [Bemisia tabaci]|uniref:Beta/gamma crystallin 'Greek key' domain-containing protein n=1 Tax=Bemisia tabaci TaxID=7038 RepID=A0A9P0ACY0_BEMTA|nr:unnamed protein product [Bemisia tabaci]
MDPKWRIATFALVSLLMLVNLVGVMGFQATAWTEFEFKGQNHSITSSSCVNLPPEFQKKVSSVNTHGRCVTLHDRKDCSGRSIVLYPGNPYHNKLSEWIFDNKAASFGPCRFKLCNNCKSKLEENH